jgi:glyoxylase-like metal-dependent hydrolase (beta-lactamase superfamily II)
MSSSVIQIHTSGSNAYLIKGDNGNILVDTCRWKHPRKILQTIKIAGLSPEDITLIILTHIHFDHVAGTAELKSICNAPVMVHSKEAYLLEKGLTNLPAGANPFSQWLSNIGNKYFPFIGKFPPSKADILVDGKYDLIQFGIDGYVLPTPGHTEGSISLILYAGEAVVGDCCIYAIEDFVLPPFANDLPLLLKTWNNFLELGCHTFWPGHGKPIPEALIKSSIPGLEKRIQKMKKR